MLVEFIICGGPDRDFDLDAAQWAVALRPTGMSSAPSSGFGKSNIDIEVDGVRISFSPEPPGWQVSMRDPPSPEWADCVAKSICQNMSLVSGYPGEVLPI